MKIVVLVGMVASGKSWTRNAILNTGDLVVNDDAIVNMLHANNYTAYETDLKPLYKSIEDHIVHCAIMIGRSVIIDRGLSIKNTARERFISLARSLDVQVSAIVFPRHSPEEHARRRFQSDSRGHTFEYWLDVARFHAKNYVTPTVEEGFDKIEFVQWDLQGPSKAV